MSDCMIDVDHISCKLGYRYILKDVQWQIQEGDRWVVFGMNGSGKTTLLSIIAGFHHYTKGQLRIFGEKVTNQNILAVRRQIGWVSASFFDKYYTKESVMDIVLSGKYGTLGIEEDMTLEDRKRAKKLLLELGLAHRVEYTFDMLSKGERQNVLIARALLPKPRILVLDEPCTGLDIYNRAYLFKLLEQLANKERLTLIYVTHYLEEIKPIFDQCLLLKEGRVFATGSTRELFTDEKMSAFLKRAVAIKKDEQEMMVSQVLGVEPKIVDFLWAD